jgi:hypothetical protein
MAGKSPFATGIASRRGRTAAVSSSTNRLAARLKITPVGRLLRLVFDTAAVPTYRVAPAPVQTESPVRRSRTTAKTRSGKSARKHSNGLTYAHRGRRQGTQGNWSWRTFWSCP